MRKLLTAFRRDESGSVLAFWAITLGVLFGVIALSFDFGRAASTQSELQGYADQVALAAAGELNANSDAIERATRAAETFITDSQTFGEGDSILSDAGDYELTFYSSPPTATEEGVETTDPTEAGYVQVTVTQQNVAAVFGNVFATLTDQEDGATTVSAQAVGGFTQYACDISPVMFCAPNSDFRADAHAGISVLLRTGGNNAAWGPGAFGFLDPSAQLAVDPDGLCAGLSGNNLDTCLISAVGNRTSCFNQNGVDVAGGQRVGNFAAALNVRFDIYTSSTRKLRNNPLYPPAPNVRSSYVPTRGQCIGNDGGEYSEDQRGLPPDDCHAAGTCDRFGNADWSTGRADYVEVNYDGVDPFPSATTRYEYYMNEIEAAASVNSGPALLNIGLQGVLPQCSNSSQGDPDRRVLVAASIDCTNIELSGGAADIPVIEFVELFMISPIGLDGTKDIWIEVIGSVGGGSGASNQEARFREVVQLYR